MKKLKLLLITPLLLGGVSGQATTNYAASNSTDIEISSAVSSNTSLFLKSNYQITTNFKVDGELPVVIVDQIGPENRTSRLYYQGYLISEQSVAKSATGGTTGEYINIQNEVHSREFLTEDGEPILYDIQYGNPLKNLANLSNSQLNSYFDIEKIDSNYILTANDLAYGVLTKNMINFFDVLSSYVYDLDTKTEEIQDLVITLNEYGEPTDMTFTKVTKDRFGAVKNDFKCVIESISELNTLTPVKAQLTEEEALEFETKLSSFQALIDKGNFTQNFSIYNGQHSYSNYYQINEDTESIFGRVMFSDMPLIDQHYGQTYVGLLDTGAGLQQFAVSPEANFSGTMSDTIYPDIAEILPQFTAISSDFFFKDGDSYIFDIEAFLHADVNFCADLLTALMSFVDPGTSVAGVYINNYTYTFAGLILSFDKDNILSGKLAYYIDSYLLATEFSFTNIGTTDITQVESLQPVVQYLLNN